MLFCSLFVTLSRLIIKVCTSCVAVMTACCTGHHFYPIDHLIKNLFIDYESQNLQQLYNSVDCIGLHRYTIN